MMPEKLVFSPSDFVAILNQTLDYAMPVVEIEGEVANCRLSRGKWLYFDIKDELASVKCFGAVYALSTPVEDGMAVRLTARPQLHALYGFSLNLLQLVPVGEGSIKRGAELLQRKLMAEGLFDDSRKRRLAYPPQRIGLVTSAEAAAYGDFIKILAARWPLSEVVLAETAVQGSEAPTQLRRAVERLNAKELDVIVIIRGGGSADDLVAFNDEQLVRAVAASRVPTMAAIGHERDVTLVELAADVRASTPSNAAELLVPECRQVQAQLLEINNDLVQALTENMQRQKSALQELPGRLSQKILNWIEVQKQAVSGLDGLLTALSPQAALARGYSILRLRGQVASSVGQLATGDQAVLQLCDGQAEIAINKVIKGKL